MDSPTTAEAPLKANEGVSEPSEAFVPKEIRFDALCSVDLSRKRDRAFFEQVMEKGTFDELQQAQEEFQDLQVDTRRRQRALESRIQALKTKAQKTQALRKGAEQQFTEALTKALVLGGVPEDEVRNYSVETNQAGDVVSAKATEGAAPPNGGTTP